MAKKYKKLFLILFLIFSISVVIYYADPYQYWLAKFLSFVRPGDEHSRTAYSGNVKIESTTFEEIIGILQEKKCRETTTTTNEISKCYYRREQLLNSGDSLVVYPNGMGWGPISFIVTKDKFFFSKDIPGKPDLEKLKIDVREDASFIGVQIRENSWELESVRYPWDVTY